MTERPTDGPLIDAIDRLTKQPTGRPVIFTCFYLLDVKGLDGQTDGLTDGRTNKQRNGRADVPTDGRTNEGMDGRMEDRTDEKTKRLTYGLTDERADRQTATPLPYCHLSHPP